jgi:hypothetical protein
MFMPDLMKGIITPMKTGTHTVHKVGREMSIKSNGTRPMAMGHINYETIARQIFEKRLANNHNEFEIAQHVRDPEKRMVSVLNHCFSNRTSNKRPLPNQEFCYNCQMAFVDLDEVYDVVRYRKEAVFPPQIHFWNKRVKLFPFEGFPILRWLGWEEEIPHEFHHGKGSRFTMEMTKGHPIHKLMMEEVGYERDYELLNRLEKQIC